MGIYARCFSVRNSNADFGEAVLEGYEYALSPEIFRHIQNAVLTGDRTALARVPGDPRYSIFTKSYATGGERQGAGEAIFVSKRRQPAGLVQQVSY